MDKTEAFIQLLTAFSSAAQQAKNGDILIHLNDRDNRYNMYNAINHRGGNAAILDTRQVQSDYSTNRNTQKILDTRFVKLVTDKLQEATTLADVKQDATPTRSLLTKMHQHKEAFATLGLPKTLGRKTLLNFLQCLHDTANITDHLECNQRDAPESATLMAEDMMRAIAPPRTRGR